MGGRWGWVLLGVLGACDDTLFPPPGGTSTDEQGWCAVKSLFGASCAGCHSAGAALGGLDLETDPYNAVVDVVSSAYGAVLVAPGDPEGSLLLRKLEDTQAASEGGPMPPGALVDAARIEAVRQWIVDGASEECQGTTGGGHHPEGWADPSLHGQGAKQGTEDCRTCHGPDLSGGVVGIACDTCHPTGWRTDCTFCHGDPESGIAAPPFDLDGNEEPATLSFPAHRLHLSSVLHADWDCTQCHVIPEDALTPGHLFDDLTPGRADVVLTSWSSPEGTYADGTCANLYCHGNGRGPTGSVHTTDQLACGDCHAVSSRWGTMSGAHAKHLEEGIACAECHPDAAPAGGIDQPELHVDGALDLALPDTMTFAGTCTGTCHGEVHSGRSWLDDDL